MSMSFYPAILADRTFNGETFKCYEPVAGYSADDCNMSNANARAVLATLGIDAEEGGAYDLAKFAGLAASWLQHNIGSRSAEESPVAERGETGPTVIHCGRREGYMNERIYQLATMARDGLANGATFLTWG